MEAQKWSKEIYAWADGETIQYRRHSTDSWVSQKNPHWALPGYFRVKPPVTLKTGSWYLCVVDEFSVDMALKYDGEIMYVPDTSHEYALADVKPMYELIPIEIKEETDGKEDTEAPVKKAGKTARKSVSSNRKS